MSFFPMDQWDDPVCYTFENLNKNLKKNTGIVACSIYPFLYNIPENTDLRTMIEKDFPRKFKNLEAPKSTFGLVGIEAVEDYIDEKLKGHE